MVTHVPLDARLRLHRQGASSGMPDSSSGSRSTPRTATNAAFLAKYPIHGVADAAGRRSEERDGAAPLHRRRDGAAAREAARRRREDVSREDAVAGRHAARLRRQDCRTRGSHGEAVEARTKRRSRRRRRTGRRYGRAAESCCLLAVDDRTTTSAARTLALELYPRLRGTVSGANVASDADSAARLRSKADDAEARELRSTTLEKATREVAGRSNDPALGRRSLRAVRLARLRPRGSEGRSRRARS